MSGTPPVTPPVTPPAAPETQPPVADEKKTVPYESHRQLLDEKKKLQKTLDDIEAARKKADDDKAAEQGEFKKLLDAERAESAKLKAENDANKVQELGRRKLAAILSGAGGTIDRKWFTTLDASGIIDSVTLGADGEIDTTSVNKAVETLKKSYPEIIQTGSGPRTPNGNPAAGGGAPGTIKHADWKKLPYAEMNKWKPDQIID